LWGHLGLSLEGRDRGETERFELASLDRSVAKAFREALERSPEKQAYLRQSEKEWLKKRDVCEARIDCLHDELWARVDELTQE
jgi:uncharacterized protein